MWRAARAGFVHQGGESVLYALDIGDASGSELPRPAHETAVIAATEI